MALVQSEEKWGGDDIGEVNLQHRVGHERDVVLMFKLMKRIGAE